MRFFLAVPFFLAAFILAAVAGGLAIMAWALGNIGKAVAGE